MSLIRTDAFLPLTPVVAAPSGGSPETRVTILSQATQARPFRPLEASANPVAHPTATPQGHGCDPKVTLQREGDRVVAIEVRCSCGQVIELACVYPEV